MRTAAYEVWADALALVGVMKKLRELEDLASSLSDGIRLAPYLVAGPGGPDNTTQREVCEVSSEEWGVGVGGAPRQRAKGRLLPNHPVRLDVPGGRLASVLLDSPDRSESGAS